MRWLAVLALVAFPIACAEELPDHVELIPGAQDVEFAVDLPSKTAYKMIGEVVGMAAANDPDAAEFAARNDLRNKAAELGATLVTVDDSIGEAMPLRDKVKVKVYGRAFKSID
jgi:hypothetical protein